MKTIGWWVLGAAFIAAPFADELFTERQAPVVSAPPVVDVPPVIRNIGSVAAEFQAAGDQIYPEQSSRELEFVLDGAADIELIAKAMDGPLDLAMLDDAGLEVASAFLPEDTDVPLVGRASAGVNRIRLTRGAGATPGTAARFLVQFRLAAQ